MPMNDLKNSTMAAAVARVPGVATDCANAYDGPKNTKLNRLENAKATIIGTPAPR
jgi:hypothetical protein